MSSVRAAPGTRRSPKTMGLPAVSWIRPSRPRARRAAASHSAVRRTAAGSWLTELRRTNSTSPSTMARRRDASRRSNAAQSTAGAPLGTRRLPALGRALAAGVGVVAREHAGVDDADLAVHDGAQAFLQGARELLGLGDGAEAARALGDAHQRQVHVGVADALAD